MRRDLGIEAAGNRAGDRVGGWPGGVVSAACGLVAAVVAGVAGLPSRHVAAALAGGVIVVFARVIALGQAVVLGVRGRALTAEEHALLTTVYRDSVDLRAVRVVPGFAGLVGMSPRPVALGATIYLKGDTDPATLVHECAHVWQYQHLGSRYTIEAVAAQLTIKPSAYRWVDELARGKTHWREFNREAQAQLLEDLAKDGFFDAERRFVHRGVDHTGLAEEAMAEVRRG